MEKKNAAKEMDSLMGYRNALLGDDQKIFDKLVEYAKSHVKACAQADLNLFNSMLLAIVLEQQKRIEALSAERGDPRTRNPNETQDKELKTEIRTRGIDLYSVFNRTEVKGQPPWVLC
jgi:hypothetical protein